MEEKKQNDFKNFDQTFMNEINDNIRERKDAEAKIIGEVEDRFYNLKMDFAKEKKQREENEERNITDLDEQISALEEDISKEKQFREDGNEKLIKSLGDKILEY